MYSVPYSFDLYSNWLGFWIHGEEEMQGEESLFDLMYYGNEAHLGCRREEYYYTTKELTHSKDGFRATGSMGAGHLTSINVVFGEEYINP